jgi:hypothetical protein
VYSKFQQPAITATVVHLSKNFITLSHIDLFLDLASLAVKVKRMIFAPDDSEEQDQVSSAVSDSDKAA